MNEIEQMISDCEERESKLSEWEASFIDNISARLRSGESLTFYQRDKLEQIWERIT